MSARISLLAGEKWDEVFYSGTMLQRTFVFIAFLISSSLAQAASPVRIQMSQLHGFWNFVLAIIDTPHSSELIRDLYDKSTENTAERRKAVADLREILSRYDSTSYSMPSFPPRRDETSWDLSAFLKLQSGKARSLNELSERVMTLMAPADHAALFANLKKLQPVYDRLVWKPLLPKLKAQKAKLETVIAKSHWPDLLDRAKVFYRADWPDTLPFDVTIFPIPAARGHTNATVIGNMASVEVLTDESDITGRLGVVFHEICHALYSAQPLAIQKEQDQHLSEALGLAAFYSYDLLDEALATAIGNGWATQRMTGSLDPRSWYDKPQINTFSKAIYPDVAAHLERKGLLDVAFLDRLVNYFSGAFPDAETDLNLRMSNLVLVVDAAPFAVDRVRLAFRKKFRMPNTTTLESLEPPEVSGAIRKKASATSILLVFTKVRRESVVRLKSEIPEIEAALRNIPADGGAVVQMTKDQRLLVLMQMDSLEMLDRTIDQLRKKGNFKDSLLKAM